MGYLLMGMPTTIVAVIAVIVVIAIIVAIIILTPSGEQNKTSPTQTITSTSKVKKSTTTTTTKTSVETEEWIFSIPPVGTNYTIDVQMYLKKTSNTNGILRVVVTIRTGQDTYIYLKRISIDNITPSNPLYSNLTREYGLKIIGSGAVFQDEFRAVITDPQLLSEWDIGTIHTVHVVLIANYKEVTETIPVKVVEETTAPITYVKE